MARGRLARCAVSTRYAVSTRHAVLTRSAAMALCVAMAACAMSSPPLSRTSTSAARDARPLLVDWDGGALEARWHRDCGRSIEFPLVSAAGRILVASSDNRVTCLDRVSGKSLWSRRIKKGIALPIAADGVSARVWVVEGLQRARLLSLDLRNGKVLAARDLARPSIALAADSLGAVVIAPDGRVSAFDPSFRAPSWQWRSAGPIAAGLCLDGDRVFVAARDDSLWALDRRDGRVVWRTATSGSRAAPPSLVDGNLVVVSLAGDVAFVSASDGRTVRRERRAAGILSAPVAWGESLVSTTPGGRVEARARDGGAPQWRRELGDIAPHRLAAVGPFLLAANGHGKLVALRGGDGDTAWSLDPPGRVSVAPLVGEEEIVVATERGEVYAYAPVP